MAGNTDNARLWGNADVYVAFDLAAATPSNVTTAFSVAWNLVGLLDGDAGIKEARSEDVADHYAWGNILMRTTRKNFKLTRTFTAFEQNAITNRLRYPGSTGGVIKAPAIERVKIAFETRDGATVQRFICSNYAEVSVDGDITQSESEVASIPFVATIYPNGSGELFIAQPALAYFTP